MTLSPYREVGLHLLPLRKRNLNVSAQADSGTGKAPRDTAWPTNKYTDSEIDEWRLNGGNVGVRLTNDWVVIDADPRNMPEGRNTLKDLAAAIGLDLTACPTVKTGGHKGGRHVYLRKSEKSVTIETLDGYEGLEFKTTGRQVVAAGSIHPKENIEYIWIEGTPPLTEAPHIPKSLEKLIARPPPKYDGTAGWYTAARLAEKLEALDPTNFREYDEWRQLAMACHHATNGSGRQEFIDWSIQDPTYTEDEWKIGRIWDGFSTERDREVTYRTLDYHLEKVGRTDLIGTEAAKDFDTTEFEDDDYDDWGLSVPDQPEHERLTPLMRMNKEYTKVLNSSKVEIFYRHEDIFQDPNNADESMRRTEWRSMSVHALKEYLSHIYVKRPKIKDGKEVIGENGEVTMKSSPIGEMWMRWPKCNTKRAVTFNPNVSTVAPDVLNLWQGWGIEPAPGEWSMIHKLIYDVLNGQNGKEGGDFVLKWCAFMIQNPTIVPEVALCFWGNKGTGKSTLGRILAKIVGQDASTIVSGVNQLTSNFNGEFYGKLFIHGEEVNPALSPEADSKLKALITDTVISYEQKFQARFSGHNTAHILLTSNRERMVNAGKHDGERRYYVARVNDSMRVKGLHLEAKEQARREKFWFDLNEEIRGAGCAALLHDLMIMDLNGWHPRETDLDKFFGVKSQQRLNMDVVGKWWCNVVVDGLEDSLIDDGSGWADNPIDIPNDEIRHLYRNFCSSINLKGYMGSSRSLPNGFLNSWRLFCPDIKTININGKRKYRIPSRDMCARFLIDDGSIDVHDIDFEPAVDLFA